MKAYQVTFNVPDDFCPEDAGLSIAYPEEKGQISVLDEGFVDISQVGVINLDEQKTTE